MERPIKKAFDLFGNDITDQENDAFEKRARDIRRKEKAKIRRQERAEQKRKAAMKSKVLSDIIMHDSDLFGNRHTEADKEAARRELDALGEMIRRTVRESLDRELSRFRYRK